MSQIEQESKGEDVGKREGETGGMGGIEHLILVMSGKGGVGKSTVTAQLARSFRRNNKKVPYPFLSTSFLIADLLSSQVGILDVDLCGPSIPKILGIQDKRVKELKDKYTFLSSLFFFSFAI
jgi:Mrp family chromosome partitioning ATPase